MNRRQKKKVYKRVAERFKRGDFSRLPHKDFDTIDRVVDGCLQRSYNTIYRPIFWDNFGKWTREDVLRNARESIDRGMREFERITGINPKDWEKYFDLNHKRGGREDAVIQSS